MSVSSGFFNSLNGDRKYNAAQMSAIFDGLIIDGVFASIGTAFAVKAAGGLTVNVGIGKAWFDHTWTVNDSILPMTAPEAEVLLDRIDAVVLEVNGMESVRENTIKFVKGNPSSAPSRPTLTNEGNVHQYPLCYIYRKYGTAVINQADITPMVGTESTPFVTGILQTISLDELLGKWQDELDRFTDARSQEVDDWIAQEESDFTAWFNKMKADLQQEQTVLDQWIASEQADFLAWYNQMKDQLGGDVAGNLQLEIDKEEVKRILLVGFEDGTKEFSDDGTVITSTASDGRTLTKTFSDGFLTMTNVLKSAAGAEVARAVKTFDSDGKLISTIVTYS
nr:MAG TPA: Receptor Binding Protein [Caudoviricetes sp.]